MDSWSLFARPGLSSISHEVLGPAQGQLQQTTMRWERSESSGLDFYCEPLVLHCQGADKQCVAKEVGGKLNNMEKKNVPDLNHTLWRLRTDI